MTFSISTICTHIILCSVMLLTMHLVLQKSAGLGRNGFIWLLLGTILLSMRLLLPFEWSVTKSIPISSIYPAITHFLAQTITLGGLFQFSRHWLLLGIAAGIAVIQIARLSFVQHKYSKYLASLPDSFNLVYTNKQGHSRKVRCVTDPSSTNALVVGLFKPQISIPPFSFSVNEWDLIIRHELSHIVSGDLWMKLLVEIVCALYWWIPFIGTLRQQMAVALELRADQSVTKALDEREKLDYLECLLKAAKLNNQKTVPFSVGFTNRKSSSLKTRFLYMQTSVKPRLFTTIIVILLVVTMVLSFFIVFEPYDIPDSVLAETFGPTDVDSEMFLVLRADRAYDVYMAGRWVATISCIPEELSKVPIIDIIKEDLGR